MNDNLIVLEIQIEDLQLIEEFKKEGRLHEDFLPFPTYDQVQLGYPTPHYGGMVVRAIGGTDANNILLPSNGMWCKVKDVLSLLKKNEFAIPGVSESRAPQKIRLIKTIDQGLNPAYSNALIGSEHEVLTQPPAEGVWIMGSKGNPILILHDEYTSIEA